MEEKDKMGFVRVENWNGEKGYIGDDDYDVIQLDDVLYLVSGLDIELSDYRPLSQAYRIVREGEETAVATIVKDKKSP